MTCWTLQNSVSLPTNSEGHSIHIPGRERERRMGRGRGEREDRGSKVKQEKIKKNGKLNSLETLIVVALSLSH